MRRHLRFSSLYIWLPINTVKMMLTRFIETTYAGFASSYAAAWPYQIPA